MLHSNLGHIRKEDKCFNTEWRQKKNDEGSKKHSSTNTTPRVQTRHLLMTQGKDLQKEGQRFSLHVKYCVTCQVISVFSSCGTNPSKQFIRSSMWKFRPCLPHRWSPVCPSCTCNTAERKSSHLLFPSKSHNSFHPLSFQTNSFPHPWLSNSFTCYTTTKMNHPFMVPLTPTTAKAQAATLDHKVNYLRLIPLQKHARCKHPNGPKHSSP